MVYRTRSEEVLAACTPPTEPGAVYVASPISVETIEHDVKNRNGECSIFGILVLPHSILSPRADDKYELERQKQYWVRIATTIVGVFLYDPRSRGS